MQNNGGHVMCRIMAVTFSLTNDKLIDSLALKVHKIENFFDSDFGICVSSLLVMSKY